MAEALRLARSKGMLRTQEQEEQRHGRTNDMKAQRTQEKDEIKAEQLRQQGGPTPPPPSPPPRDMSCDCPHQTHHYALRDCSHLTNHYIPRLSDR